MCGCENHWDASARCTCSCPGHGKNPARRAGDVVSGDVGAEVALTDAERRALHEGVCARHSDTSPGVYVCGPCERAGDKAVERILTARIEQARADEGALRERVDAAEAEADNAQADYDRRGERLWRLAAKAGWTPGNEADNDATAELFVTRALARGAASVEVLAELVCLKDGPRDAAYRATKEGAWDRARATLTDTAGDPT